MLRTVAVKSHVLMPALYPNLQRLRTISRSDIGEFFASTWTAIYQVTFVTGLQTVLRLQGRTGFGGPSRTNRATQTDPDKVRSAAASCLLVGDVEDDRRAVCGIARDAMQVSLADQPYIAFLSAYPHPAFILSLASQTHPSFTPTFANAALRRVLLGPDARTSELGSSFQAALTSVEQARRLTNWAFPSDAGLEQIASTITLEFIPQWMPNPEPVVLEFSQTRVGDALICTSTPRSALPPSGTQTPMPFPESPAFGNYGTASNANTPPPFPQRYSSDQSVVVRDYAKSPTGQQWFETESFGRRAESCVELLEGYPWEKTPLGPRKEWSDALIASVTYALSCPFPTCVLWGTDLTLIYNEAYAETVGNQHPDIFGKTGAVAWAEIWSDIGPLSESVMKGKTVHRLDDLLFVNSLTETNLPQEQYQSWTYVPVRDRDGNAVGLIKQTVERTQKVIADRRMELIRELSTTAAAARTYNEFSASILEVLKAYPLDAPFAAMYQATVVEAPDARSREKNLQDQDPQQVHITPDTPYKIRLTLSGTVGVPVGHASVPVAQSLYLNTKTLASTAPGEGQSQLSMSQSELDDVESTTDGFPAVAPSTYRDKSNSSVGSSIDSFRMRALDAAVAAAPASTAGTGTGSGTSQSIRESFWPFADVFAANAAVHVPHIPAYVVQGFDARGWNEQAREAVLIPLTDSTVANGTVPSCVIILGLNSRRSYDAHYRSWMDLVRMSLNSLLEAVKGREADIARATQLAQLDEAKTAFFSNASHEFRTPLTLIQGPLEDAIPYVRDTATRENLEMALRNTARLKRLVDSLLDFSKLAAKKLTGRFRPVALGPYTADLASLFNSVIQKAHVKYTVACRHDDGTVAYIDPEFWEKIVVNLIGNAFKYTLEGEISVKLDVKDGYIHLTVQDTGVGIPAADIDKVFDRFHRANSVGRSYEGTGIGLALTKELVILHGGRISLKSLTAEDSPDNHGSRFTVSIPLGHDHLPQAHIDPDPLVLFDHGLYSKGIIDEAVHWTQPRGIDGDPHSAMDNRSVSSGSATSGTSTTASTKLEASTLFFSRADVILLVDDSTDLRRYVRGLLQPYCTIVESENGEDALRIMSAVRPNLIITDVMMPGLDGYGLIAKLRERPDTRLLPIILLTAKETAESRVEGLLSGADDYLAKPFNAKELIARAHLQMQLGKRRAQLETLFQARTREIKVLSDLSPVGLFRVNANGTFVYANQRWVDITGVHAADEASFESMLKTVHDDDVARVEQEWRKILETRQSASFEHAFKNGTYVQQQWEPLSNEDGDSDGFICTITDITAQRKLEQARIAHAEERERFAQERAELAEMRRKEADERRRGQELLIDVTSHELRQPVSAILNCASVLRANLGALHEELQDSQLYGKPYMPTEKLLQSMVEDLEAIDAMYQCGLAQERIANDVLSLSRIQLGALSIHPVEFQPVEETRGLISVFNKETSMKRISILLNVGESFKQLGVKYVRADKARFRQILTNLMSNGIKFTDMSSTARDIIVTVNISRREPVDGADFEPPERPEAPLTERDYDEPVPLYVHCSVKDSGPGIHPDDLVQLFKRFQQGTNSEKTFGGSGLGLFVSRKLCDLMDGKISVTSVFGHGATFQFYIRVEAVSPKVEPPRVAPSPSLASTIKSRGLNVLLVEDNLINQTILNRQLKTLGCTTVLADHGLQAIDRLRDRAAAGQHFDVILMDCEMPVMDGLTATREIRKLEATGKLPRRSLIFALTGNAREGQIQLALDSGMDSVMIKPYRIDELMSKVLEATADRDAASL
ncbi:unnamed protein product [Peniophora sp. CBMAI 1063]|nr:unnamed protein product [Peniophora sp. CBMAI 1063]